MAFDYDKLRASAYLALADGRIFPGRSVGAAVDRPGEAVFNTAMTGYQEILTDPSYLDQFVCLTAPEIGNVGVNREDGESDRFRAAGLIAHRVTTPSNWRSETSLAETLARAGIPALAEVDTRALTRHLRDHGAMKSFLCASGAIPPEEGVVLANRWPGLDGQDATARVTRADIREWRPDETEQNAFAGIDQLPRPVPCYNVAVYDFGVKTNILRALHRVGLDPLVLPAATPPEAVLERRPDGIFLSNGPGDPAGVSALPEILRTFLTAGIPLFGICLGHQLLGRAIGARTYRLPFGHHGANHPVRCAADGRVLITSQNHNFAVDAAALDTGRAEITHISLNDGSVEGLRLRDAPAFSVQFHPEAAPGPRDAFGLFMEFRALIERVRGAESKAASGKMKP